MINVVQMHDFNVSSTLATEIQSYKIDDVDN